MTLREWNRLHALIVALWPQTQAPTVEALELSLPVVEHLEFEHACQIVRAFSMSGEKWPPAPGEIAARSALDRLPAAPAWPEAKALIVQACGRFGRDREADGLRWLAGRAPQVARFCADQWRQLCDAEIDGDYGSAVETRWRQDFQTVCRQMGDEIAQGQLRPVVRDRLAHLEHGQPGARKGLRQMNPAAALPAPAGELAEESA